MENTNIVQPEIIEAVPAVTVPAEIESEAKRAKAKTKTPRTASSAKTKKSKAKAAKPLTDEQKRLARNAALREWRKKNADKFNAYMKSWRENKKKEAAKAARAKKTAAKKGAARE